MNGQSEERKINLNLSTSNLCCEIIKMETSSDDICSAQIDIISSKLLINTDLSLLAVPISDKDKENTLE